MVGSYKNKTVMETFLSRFFNIFDKSSNYQQVSTLTSQPSTLKHDQACEIPSSQTLKPRKIQTILPPLFYVLQQKVLEMLHHGSSITVLYWENFEKNAFFIGP